VARVYGQPFNEPGSDDCHQCKFERLRKDCAGKSRRCGVPRNRWAPCS
jgi:hypothetical protein